jgi:hypothetical protein
MPLTYGMAGAGLNISANGGMTVGSAAVSSLSTLTSQGLTTQLVPVLQPAKADPAAAPVSGVTYHPSAARFSSLGSDAVHTRVLSDGGICRVGGAR